MLKSIDELAEPARSSARIRAAPKILLRGGAARNLPPQGVEPERAF